MPTQEDVESILKYINKCLEDAREHGATLAPVNKQDTQFEDDWLYITVAPGTKGGRASDYAELMAEIESGLRDEKYNNVLLVPVLGD